MTRSRGAGGVQWCTKEYLDTLRAAGFVLKLIEYVPDRSWLARASRRLRPRPFSSVLSEELVERIATEARNAACRWIFLNNTEALPVASKLRSRLTGAKFIFLSHGAEITDVVNNLRLTPNSMPRFQKRNRWLGQLTRQELSLRRTIDGTLCMSANDVQIEQWLGCSKSIFVPRQVRRFPIELTPVAGRLGCVATLNHGPNLHGLELFLTAVDGNDLCVRLVGGPADIGEQLALAHASVSYLGPLDEAALLEEAKTWTSFVNPIFCQARGASTKVATALGWGLPVLTTSEGARGYRWNEAAIPLARTPKELVAFATEVASSLQIKSWQERANRIADEAPSNAEAAGLVRDFLFS